MHTKILLLWSMLISSMVLIWCGSDTKDIADTTQDTQDAVVQPDDSELIAKEALPVSPRTIHALWDSLTAGFGLPIQDSYPSQLEQILLDGWYDIQVLNGGISWDTSRWLLERLDRQLEPAVVDDIALLVIWANDGLRWLPLDQMRDNITMIVEEILERDLFLVIWSMQIPLNNAPEYRAAFADVYVDICDAYVDDDRVSCIPFFLDWVWWVPRYNLPDGIHPTREWYSIVVDNTLPYVQDILDR